MAACAIVLLVAFGLTATAREGFPARFTPAELEVVTHLLTAPDETWRSGTCFLYDNRSDYRLTPDCLAVDPTKKNYLLLGDSHAAQLSYGLAAEFPQIHFLQATAADCYPTLSHTVTENHRCIGLVDGVLKDFLAHTPVDNLIIAARWRPSVFDSLAQTLAWLRERHVRVTLLGPTYPFDAPMPRLVMRALRTEDPQRVWRHRDESAKEWDASLREMARAQGIDYISLTDLQCKRYPCQSEGSPWPEMFDSEHFNNLGARIIARRIRETDALFGQ